MRRRRPLVPRTGRELRRAEDGGGRLMSGPGKVLAHLGRVPGVLAVVLHNRELGRVLAAYSAFLALEWGTWITVIVYAYGNGGATTAGVVAFVQLIPAMILSPFAAVLGDRFRAGRVLVVVYAANAAAVLAMAGAIEAGATPLAIYGLAAVSATCASFVRPPLFALAPTLARSPLELTSANVATGWVESMTVLVAPAVTGVLLGASGEALALLVLGCAGVLSFLLALPVTGPPPLGSAEPATALGELTGGVRMLRNEPEPRMLLILLGALYLGTGALDVLYAQLALGALDVGQAWAGYFNAAFGLGGALGVAATVSIVGRRRLIGPLLTAVGLWAATLTILAVVPSKASAVILLAAAGVSWTMVDVTGRTLLQRAAPSDLVSRVFGLLEGANSAGLALGAILVPAFVAIGGTTAALIGTAAILPVTLAVTWRRLRDIDRTATVPIVEIGLLRSIDLFRPLSPPTLESIALQLEHVDVPEGTPVVVQGEPGDRWYAIADGRLQVARDDVVLAELGRGEAFGEIALLRDVPRTATVTALTDCALYSLEKEAFLEAVTGHAQVIKQVDEVVEGHLAAHRDGRGQAEG